MPRLIALLLLCLPLYSQAVTLYVATNGDDRNTGQALDSPFQTLKKAVRSAIAGDTILVREGTYDSVLIFSRGREDAWITMRPYRSEKVIIDAGNNKHAVYFYDKNKRALYWELRGFEIKGGKHYAVKIDTPWVRIVDNNIHGSRADLIKLVGSADDVEILNNRLHDNLARPAANAQAVDIVGADRTRVAFNLIYNIPSFGIYTKGSARGTVFENNYFRDIYETAVMLGQSSSRRFIQEPPYESYDGIIRNNVVINTGRACFGTSSSFNARIYNNSCYNVATRAHGAIYLTSQGDLFAKNRQVHIANNLLVVSSEGGRPMVKLGPGAISGYGDLKFENNLYWNTAGKAEDLHFYAVDQDLSGIGFEQWRKITGLDHGTIVADPRILDRQQLTLTSGSPALGAGIPLPEVRTDYNQLPRPAAKGMDIGAHQMSTSAAPATNPGP